MLFFLASQLVFYYFTVQYWLDWLHLYPILRICTILKAVHTAIVELVQLKWTALRCLLEEVLRCNSSNGDRYA